MARVDLVDVRKEFGEHVALHEMSLELPDGEFTVLLGPSGCGKSTTLNLIAGLEELTAGRILFDGEPVHDVPPQRRDVAVVFQSYALYPNRTVRGNIAFGLKLRGHPRADIAPRVEAVAQRLSIDALLDRRPRQLSGGQQQRVALARAMVRNPRVFLLDEPLSNLDAQLRAEMRISLQELQRELGATFVFVTHDQGEAMSLADRVVVMKDGTVQQVGPPMAIYDTPANWFVATFVGSPAMNGVAGELDGDGWFSASGLRCEAPPTTRPGSLRLGVRPEGVKVASPNGGNQGVVRVVQRLGTESLIVVGTPAGDLVARVQGPTPAAPADRVSVELDPDALHFFDLESGERL